MSSLARISSAHRFEAAYLTTGRVPDVASAEHAPVLQSAEVDGRAFPWKQGPRRQYFAQHWWTAGAEAGEWMHAGLFMAGVLGSAICRWTGGV